MLHSSSATRWRRTSSAQASSYLAAQLRTPACSRRPPARMIHELASSWCKALSDRKFRLSSPRHRAKRNPHKPDAQVLMLRPFGNRNPKRKRGTELGGRSSVPRLRFGLRFVREFLDVSSLLTRKAQHQRAQAKAEASFPSLALQACVARRATQCPRSVNNPGYHCVVIFLDWVQNPRELLPVMSPAP